MKYIVFGLIAIVIIACNQQSMNSDSQSDLRNSNTGSFSLILPVSLENRRDEFRIDVNAAIKNISYFAAKNGWEVLTQEIFFDSVFIFDNKIQFNVALLKAAGADTTIELPETYCAALEKRILFSVIPEYYSKVFPEGIENKSFEKLLTHEIAHQLHIRILKGDEDAMGPIWFYEGFAMYAADQFAASAMKLNKQEMIQIMNTPERGSYMKYNYIFRYFAQRFNLKELIFKAKDKNFNDKMVEMIP